ncbi:MAG: MFS transporter [Candidatus Korarchaeota archaeon]|nr:MFS transporter [Candidatus Korarchaeota archaeon]
MVLVLLSILFFHKLLHLRPRFKRVKLLSRVHRFFKVLSCFFLAILPSSRWRTQVYEHFFTLFLSKALFFKVQEANTILTIFFVGTAIGTLFGGVLADRFRSKHITILLMVLSVIISGLILLCAPWFTFFTISCTFGGLGVVFGSASPARDRLVSSIASKGSTGQAFGLAHIDLPLGGLFAPSLVGFVMDLQSTVTGYLLIPLFLVGTVPILLPISTEK